MNRKNLWSFILIVAFGFSTSNNRIYAREINSKNLEQTSKHYNDSTGSQPIQFVFGSQYFRYPTPTSESWMRDLANMKQMGMNTVKIFICWNEVEPEEGHFDFTTFDTLMDNIDKNGLKAVINFIYKKPDWVANGVVRSLDNPQYFNLVSKFLSKTAEHYATHPALLLWDCWNEPSITYSSTPETIEKYRKWLQRRYSSTKVAARAWGVPFLNNWGEVDVPSILSQLPKSLDWYRFNREHLPEQFEQLAAVIRKNDPHHLVMVHDVRTGVTHLNCYNDELNMRPLDLHGVSLHILTSQYGNEKFTTENCRYAFALALKGNISRRLAKPLWISETFGGSQTFSIPSPPYPGPETIRKNLWEAVAYGVQGFLFWQYRPERFTSTPEDGGWGLTDLAGNGTERTKAVEEFTKQVAPLVSLVPLKPEGSRFAIVVNDMTAFTTNNRKKPEQLDPKNPFTVFEYQKLSNPYGSAVLGAFRAFQDCNIPVDIIYDRDSFDNYDLLYFPLPMQLDKEVAERIRSFVKQGGTAVMEGGAGFYGENGWVSETVPAYGLDEVFGINEKESVYHGDNRTFIEDSLKVPIAYRTSNLNVKSARIVGRFPNGQPAKTENNYGEGKAVYLASSPSIAVFSQPANTGEAMMLSLGLKSEIVGDRIQVRRASHGDNEVIFIFNHSGRAQTVSLKELQNGEFISIRGKVKVSGKNLQCHIPGQDLVVVLKKIKLNSLK